MKTWDRFLEEVEFLASAMTKAPQRITKDFTRDNSEEEVSSGEPSILYMAYGVDNDLGLLQNANWGTWSTRKNWVVNDNDYPRLILTPRWMVLYGLFPSEGAHLLYKVQWEAGVCKYAINKERQVCYMQTLRSKRFTE